MPFKKIWILRKRRNDKAVMSIVSSNLTPNAFETGDNTSVYYKGKKRLYNLKAQKLLEDRVLTKKGQSFRAVGTTYKVVDNENKPQILDASGKVIEKDASDLRVSDDCCCYVAYGYGYEATRVYDDHLKVLATSNKDVRVLMGKYFSLHGDDGKYGIMTLDGSILVEPVYDQDVEPMEGETFKVAVKDNSGDKLYGVVDKTGKTLVEPKYSNSDIYELAEGYFYVKEDGGSERYSLYAPGGRLVSDKIIYEPTSTLVAGISDYDVLILNTGETLTISEGSDGKVLDTALVSIYSPETRRYGAFELRDGKQLLDYEWENIIAAYGRLYAYKDGVWHVFAY